MTRKTSERVIRFGSLFYAVRLFNRKRVRFGKQLQDTDGKTFFIDTVRREIGGGKDADTVHDRCRCAVLCVVQKAETDNGH